MNRKLLLITTILITTFFTVAISAQNYKQINDEGEEFLEVAKKERDEGLLKEALEKFKTALKVNREFLKAYDNAAMTSVFLGDYDEAIKFLKEKTKYELKKEKILQTEQGIRNVMQLFQPTEVLFVKGESRLLKSQGDANPVLLKPGMNVATGQVVRTNAEAKINFRLYNGCYAELGPESELEFTQVLEDRGEKFIKLKLLKGYVMVNLARNIRDGKFKIFTPHAVCAARNAAFMVDYSKERTMLYVDRGKVDVININKPNFPQTIAEKQKSGLDSLETPDRPEKIKDEAELKKLEEIRNIPRGKWTDFSAKYGNGLLSDEITGVKIIGDFIWAGTSKGMSVYGISSKKWSAITKLDGLIGNNVKNVYLENEYMWIMTDAGLSILNMKKGNIENYGKNEGVFSNNLAPFYSDTRYVWVSTGDTVFYKLDKASRKFETSIETPAANEVIRTINFTDTYTWYGLAGGRIFGLGKESKVEYFDTEVIFDTTAIKGSFIESLGRIISGDTKNVGSTTAIDTKVPADTPALVTTASIDTNAVDTGSILSALKLYLNLTKQDTVNQILVTDTALPSDTLPAWFAKIDTAIISDTNLHDTMTVLVKKEKIVKFPDIRKEFYKEISGSIIINGILWYSTEGKGLIRYDINANAWDVISGSFNSSTVNCFVFDGETMWIGTSKGLNTYNTATKEVGKFEFEGNPYIRDIFLTEAAVFMATNKGLYMMNKNAKNVKVLNKTLAKSHYERILSDGTYLWLKKAGEDVVVKYEPEQTNWRRYGKEHPLFSVNTVRKVFSMTAVPGRCYVGGQRGFAEILTNPDTFLITDLKKTLGDAGISNIIIDGEYMLVLTRRDVVRFKQGMVEGREPVRFTATQGLSGSEYFDGGVDNSSIWIATRKQGLFQYERGKNFWKWISKKSKTNPLMDDFITAFATDERYVWIGYYSVSGGNIIIHKGTGALDKQTGKWKWFDYENTGGGLVSNKINSIKTNGFCAVIGTDMGLSVYDYNEEKWVKFTEENGLISNIVSGVDIDDRYIWIATPEGVARY